MQSAIDSPRCALSRPSTIASFADKRTVLIVTTGGWELRYRPRGIDGPIGETPFPTQHGFLYYLIFDVVPSFVGYCAGRMDEARFVRITQVPIERLDTLLITAPIPFCRQNVGDYDIPALTLRGGITSRESGFATHLAQTPA